ncbi:unnamed protein product, partial [Mesorhabditis belari]|uniref:non-specific serine/threonine protein kinase n=1 Tax=Mesorhabditis belari TaxID=2138241 RepID=A0AAF3FE88_9BILA
MIRNSLRPFESQVPEPPPPPVIPLSADQQLQMINLLVQAGHEREQAFLALKLVNFKSVTAAGEILNNINKDPRVAMNDQRLNGLNGLFFAPSSSMISSIQSTSGYGSRTTSQTLTSSLHPYPYPSTSQFDDNDSPRSASPSGPSLPSTQPPPLPQSQVRSPSPNRHHMNLTPVQQQDYHRSHAHIQLRQSYPGEEALRTTRSPQQTPPIGHKAFGGTTIVIEKDLRSHDSRQRTGMGNGIPRRLPPTEAIPVIKTTLSRPPPGTTKVNINVEPSNLESSRRAAFRLDVISAEGCSTVAGVPGGMTGVQNILVDPDKRELSSAYVNYVDKLLHRQTRIDSSTVVPSNDSLMLRMGRISPNQHQSIPGTSRDTHGVPETSSSSANVRSISPLPPSVEQRRKTNTFESVVKPIKPKLYRFFMEQHIERVVQAHRERMRRTQQLTKEMEAANLPEVMKENMLKFLTQKENRYMRLKRQKMNKEMFKMIKHIGVGAFGRVTLVKKKDTDQVYAMKSLLKNDVILKQQASHVKAERDILAEANSPWIVKLFFSFQDERCLYFIMEYVPGGDMMQLLINKEIFSESLAKFYIAELTCAIEYVHSLKFIHRDIKPDNILIDRDGHIKLTDFGLCTGLRWTHDRKYYGPDNEDYPGAHNRNDSLSLPDGVNHIAKQMKVLDVRHQRQSQRNQALSVVGTGNYMAPEVIRKTGHTQLCDWWSVGVILYEMVIGRPPFMSMKDDPMETQQKINQWHRFLDLSCTQHLSRDCVSMIEKLICEESDRLGGTKGAAEVKAHKWFQGIDFKTLRQQKAEFIPRVEHAEDTRNFDTIEVNESPFETLSKGKAPNNPAFFEFTFRHFFDYDGQGCPSLRPHPIKRPSLAPLFENGHASGGPSTSFTANSNSQARSSTLGSVTRSAPSQPFRSLGGLHNTPLHEDEDSGESFVV